MLAHFKPQTPDTTAALVAGIEQKLAAAQADAAKARTDYAAVAVAVELDEMEPDARPVKTARTALSNAEARVSELQYAMSAARERHQKAQEAAAASDRTRRWNTAEKLANEAQALAEQVEDHAAAMLEAQAALSAKLVEFHQTAPKRDDQIAHSACSPAATENSLRQHLLKSGCHWAWRYLGDIAAMPTLSARVAHATTLTLGLRDDGR